jgi:cation diffusion facilitator CzcD-associated flavoprotein CzcO
MTVEHIDVLIVGAGVSGIDAAYHLKTTCPDRSYAILEGREAIGGTWDLFRFPGIRSDSDMYTYGFPFWPWTGRKSIADGASIRHRAQDPLQASGDAGNVVFEGCALDR